MDARVISKSSISDWLDDLIGQCEVWAPVDDDGVILFEQIRAAREASLDYANSKMSPKGLLFPQSETMFLFEGTEFTEPPPIEERVLFGLRPCDGHSLAILDKVFYSPQYPSVYYGRRREQTHLVGLGCNRPSSTCFCTALGGDPFGEQELDILLTDLGDRYLAEAFSDWGREALKTSPRFEEAAALDWAAKEQAAQEAREMLALGPNVEGLSEKLADMFDDPVWDEVSQECLGCGACSYVCPTCHCFDIVDELDEPGGSQGRRVRVWDSCQYPLFTHHSSGHNPRPSGMARTRQRVMHKFHYYVENFGATACVGCGRCIRACPVNLDIRRTLARLAQG